MATLVACKSSSGDAPSDGSDPAKPGAAAFGPAVLVDAAWTGAGPPGPPPGERMQPRFMVVDREGTRLLTVEDEAELPMRSWLRIRDTADLSVKQTLPLCLAGPPTARVSVPCANTAAFVRAAAFARDGSAIAIACLGCASGAPSSSVMGPASLHVVDTATGALRFAVGLAFDPDQVTWNDESVVVAGYRMEVGPGYAVVDAKTGTERRATTLDESIVGFSPDGLAFLTGASREVRLLDGSARWSTGYARDKAVLFDGGGAAKISSIDIRRIAPGGKEGPTIATGGDADLLVVTSDGRYAAAVAARSDAPSIVRLVAFDDQDLVFERSIDGKVDAAAVLPNGTVLVAGGPEGLRAIAAGPKARALALSPDGTTLAAAETDGPPRALVWTLRLRDATTLEQKVATSCTPTRQIVFAPNGRRLATVEADAGKERTAIGLRSAATAELERSVELPFAVLDLAWGDGKLLVAGARTAATIDPDTAVATTFALPDDTRLESVAPDASAIAIRTQGGPYHEPIAGGGHATVIPPARIERLAPDGARALLVDETRGSVILLAGGAWLLVDGTVERHDAAGAVIDRTTGGDVFLTTPDGARVLQSGGDYGLTARALGSDAPLVHEPQRARELAAALAVDGTIYFAPPGGGIVRRSPSAK